MSPTRPPKHTRGQPPASATQRPSEASADSQSALQDALRAVLRPLADLALAQGLPCSVVEDLTRQAFIDAARQPLLQAGLPEHRLVSRISTATGINRREVTRLTASPEAPGSATPEPISLASEVFAAWVGHRKLRLPNGQPRPLKRQGTAPSFEALTRGITLDVHPRSVLDELCRLGLARLDADTDTVHLLRTTFVPGGDQPQLLRFLGDNVGDHLQAAVDNVKPSPEPKAKAAAKTGKASASRREHFDQAVFCDELSPASLDKLQAFVSAQWQRIVQEAMPLLEACYEADKHANATLPPQARTNTQRARIGLYSYEGPMQPTPTPPEAEHTAQAAPASKRTPRKTKP